MDPLVLLLLVIIVLAGGIIGVLADHLGRKIGKKKLSFRSMRPKHVARLGTFIAGALVSLITILLVYSTSSGIRDWINQGRAAIARSKMLTAQNAALEDTIKSKASQIDQLDRDAKVARASLFVARTKLAAIKSDLTTANSRLAEARQLVTIGKVALARNQVALSENKALLHSRQAQLAEVATNLKNAAVRYAALKGSYSSVNRQRTEANDEVVNLRNQETSLGTEIRNLQDEAASLTKEKERATADLQSARDELHDSRLTLASVKNDLETARDELARAQQTTSRILNVALDIRSLPLTYSVGQEVARKHIPPHLSVRQAHDALTVLIQQASVAAKARGAGKRENSDSYAFVLEQEGPNGTLVKASDIEDAIVASLTSSNRDVVLVARAAINAFRGEAVALEIVGHPNPIIYRKGEVLGVLSVARRSPAVVVFSQFNDFMSQRIHDRAIKDGMIPASGREGSLLDLAPAKTLELVEHLANSDRAQQLQIVARADTRAADSLQLDFLIK
ncbi:MAG: DUF3084 domain-containing protein [Fimbriimonadaceae bacterium]